MTAPTSGEILAASIGWAAYGTQDAPPSVLTGLDGDTRQALWTEASGLCDVIRDKITEVYGPDE